MATQAKVITTRTPRAPSTKTAAHKRAIGRGMAAARAKRAQAPITLVIEAPVAPVQNIENDSTAINDGRAVTCAFPGSNNRYTYRTRDESLAIGDFALVVSPYGNDRQWNVEGIGFLSIVRISDIAAEASPINSKSKSSPKWVSKLVLPTS